MIALHAPYFKLIVVVSKIGETGHMTPILRTIVCMAGLASMAGMAATALCAAKAVARMAKLKQDETSSEKEQTSKA